MDIIVPISSSLYPNVICHLRQNFFPDEPLNKAVGLCKRGEAHVLLEEHSNDTMRDGVSVAVIITNGGSRHLQPDVGSEFDTELLFRSDIIESEIEQIEIVGVALNGILTRSSFNLSADKLKVAPDEKFRRIFGLLHSVNKGLKLFDKYGVEEIFECRIVSVDNKYRGKGIAKKLIRKSEQIAREKGFKLIKVDATSAFSQRVCLSLGFHPIATVPYCEQIDASGAPLFPTNEPHSTFEVMVKVLNTENCQQQHATFN